MPPPSSARSVRARKPVGLPAGFTRVRDVFEGIIQPGRMVNLAGVVKDRRLPMPTRNKDFKSTLTLVDSADDDADLQLTIFRPEAEQPEASLGDVVMLFQVKVQLYQGVTSLITHFQTIIRVFSASKILKPPRAPRAALQPVVGRTGREPNDLEIEYAVYLCREMAANDVLPDESEFHARTQASMHIKEKFCLLRDVTDGRFCDVVARLVRPPYDDGEKMTLYLSDYTENTAFHHQAWDGEGILERDGDPYGYTSKFAKKADKNGGDGNAWFGPYGKMSIQVTCWNPHADFLRESELEPGQWLLVRNLQVKFGHSSANLEGFLRGDQQYTSKVNITLLDPQSLDVNQTGERLKEALRRCRDYEKKKKAQLKEVTSEAVGSKRKADEPSEEELPQKMNRKVRRMLEQEAIAKEIKARKDEARAKLGLNERVSSESASHQVSSVEDILEQLYYDTKIDGQDVKLPLPFVCAKYTANVRVVDFSPRRLEDFASMRLISQYDGLSDNSDGEDSIPSDDEEIDAHRVGGSKGTWEWRFALELEDVSPKTKEPKRIWVLVDNFAAQCLTGLDASNLHKDEDNLSALREKLFTLWGNLEELKSQELVRRDELRKKHVSAKHIPPPSSDMENIGAGRQLPHPALSNKPFNCCIQQFGVKEPQKIPRLADAGEGKRWKRVFHLFGTKITA